MSKEQSYEEYIKLFRKESAKLVQNKVDGSMEDHMQDCISEYYRLRQYGPAKSTFPGLVAKTLYSRRMDKISSMLKEREGKARYAHTAPTHDGGGFRMAELRMTIEKLAKLTSEDAAFIVEGIFYTPDVVRWSRGLLTRYLSKICGWSDARIKQAYEQITEIVKDARSI